MIEMLLIVVILQQIQPFVNELQLIANNKEM